jgi:phage-related protein
MTCGAVGAIVYGWKALSDDERNAILEKLTAAFDVGVELIRSIIQYVINGMRELLSSDSVADLKRMVAGAANAFGRSLSDVTHAVKDRIFDLATSVSDGVSNAAGTVGDAVSAGAGAIAEGVGDAAASVSKHVADTIDRIPAKLTTVPVKPKAQQDDKP